MAEETFKIAVVGYGNIGKAIVSQAQKDVNSDIKVVGVIRRNSGKEVIDGTNIRQVSKIEDLPEVPNVVMIATPSHIAPETAVSYLEKGFATVDCFDDHSRREEVKALYNKVSISNKTVAVMMSGWDPGIDSAIRALVSVLSPEGDTYTKFGGTEGGRSMGHTTTVKSIKGVKDAVSITKEGPNLYNHGRDVYVVADEGADKKEIEKQILQHPYFKNDETVVNFVDDISKYDTDKHGGHVFNTGVDASADFKLSGVNAVMTANFMIGSARAAVRLVKAGRFGAFTIPEVAPIDFVKGDDLSVRLNNIHC